jgi:hypothetical protein
MTRHVGRVGKGRGMLGGWGKERSVFDYVGHDAQGGICKYVSYVCMYILRPNQVRSHVK